MDLKYVQLLHPASLEKLSNANVRMPVVYSVSESQIHDALSRLQQFHSNMTAARPKSPALRIFVVEDHNDSLEVLRIYLESFGYVILSARSKAEALKANSHSRLPSPSTKS